MAIDGLLQRVIYSPETTERKEELRKLNCPVLYNLYNKKEPQKITTFIVYQQTRSLNKVHSPRFNPPNKRIPIKTYR